MRGEWPPRHGVALRLQLTPSLAAVQTDFVMGFPVFPWLGSQMLNQLWSMIPYSSSGQL